MKKVCLKYLKQVNNVRLMLKQLLNHLNINYCLAKNLSETKHVLKFSD